MKMTYICTQPELGALAKRKKLKLAAIAFATIAVICAMILIGTPKSKPIPLATQPATFELTNSRDAMQKAYRIPEGLTYKAIDNTIRETQVDVAHLGHSMKLALVSDRNPVKQFIIGVERKYSVMGMMVGLAFIFTLFSFGFIRTAKDDLANY